MARTHVRETRRRPGRVLYPFILYSCIISVCMYVCLDRLRTHTDTHDTAAAGPSSRRASRWVDLAFARVSVLVRQICCARQAHAMASRARHCSRGSHYRSRYCRSPHDHRVWGCLSACARMTHSCQLPMRKQARRHCFHPHMAWDARCQDEHRLTSHRSELPRCRCLYRPTARDLT